MQSKFGGQSAVCAHAFGSQWWLAAHVSHASQSASAVHPGTQPGSQRHPSIPQIDVAPTAAQSVSELQGTSGIMQAPHIGTVPGA